MIRIFKHYIPKSILYLAAIECIMLYLVIWLALAIRFDQIGDPVPGFNDYTAEKIFYVVIVM